MAQTFMEGILTNVGSVIAHIGMSRSWWDYCTQEILTVKDGPAYILEYQGKWLTIPEYQSCSYSWQSVFQTGMLFSIHWFTLQIPTAAETRPSQSLELGAHSRSARVWPGRSYLSHHLLPQDAHQQKAGVRTYPRQLNHWPLCWDCDLK